jgi:mannose-6-phosphate isomerase
MTIRQGSIGPLLLEGSLHETIWGGRNLAHVAGKHLPEGVQIGESWETAVDSVVRNPPHAGCRLGELVERYGERLIGRRAEALLGRRFPLLAKFLDAQQWLSVQVHPDDHYAREHEGGKLGKTETWYVLRAEPGAKLVYGLAQPATPAEVRSAIAETRLEPLLNLYDASPGDVLLVPAGTVHAIGSGIVLYELQEYSDVTYRLYDYGRLQADGMPRALHVEQGLEVMRYTAAPAQRPVPVAVPGPAGVTRQVLVACAYFVLEAVQLVGELHTETDGSSCHILTVLEGTGTLRAGQTEVTCALGDTVVVPAEAGRYVVAGADLRLVRSWVPEATDASLLVWRQGQSEAGS